MSAQEPVQHVSTAEQLNQVLSASRDRLIVVDFGATWCGPCRNIAPFFHDLAANTPNATFLSIDADELPEVVEACKVSAFPTFLFFKNSQLLGQVLGAGPDQRSQLTALVAQHAQGAQAARGVPIHVSDDLDFENQINAARGGLVVVDFFTTWCGPCRKIAPVFEQLAAENPDVVFLKVNAEECFESARECKVSAYPTFLFYKDGLNCGMVRGGNAQQLAQKILELKDIPAGEILEYYRSIQSQ